MNILGHNKYIYTGADILKFIGIITLDNIPSLVILLKKVGETKNDHRDSSMEIFYGSIRKMKRVQKHWKKPLAL